MKNAERIHFVCRSFRLRIPIHVSTVLCANACPFLELKLNIKSEFNLFIRKSTAQDYGLNKVDKENCYLPISVTILLKNPTNALIYVNTTLFTLLHCYMFQPSRGHPQGVLIHFMSRVNKVHVQM